MKIMGVDMPDGKRIDIGLRKIYGIGPKKASDALKACGIDAGKKAGDLTKPEIAKLTSYVSSNYVVEGGLKRAEKSAVDRLVRIGSVRGRKLAAKKGSK